MKKKKIYIVITQDKVAIIDERCKAGKIKGAWIVRKTIQLAIYYVECAFPNDPIEYAFIPLIESKYDDVNFEGLLKSCNFSDHIEQIVETIEIACRVFKKIDNYEYETLKDVTQDDCAAIIKKIIEEMDKENLKNASYETVLYVIKQIRNHTLDELTGAHAEIIKIALDYSL